MVKLQAKDETSGAWVDIPNAAFASASATTTKTMSVHPTLTTAANVAVPELLGDTIRAYATVSTNPATFSVGVDLVR